MYNPSILFCLSGSPQVDIHKTAHLGEGGSLSYLSLSRRRGTLWLGKLQFIFNTFVYILSEILQIVFINILIFIL